MEKCQTRNKIKYGQMRENLLETKRKKKNKASGRMRIRMSKSIHKGKRSD